jgi:hypothetical protein
MPVSGQLSRTTGEGPAITSWFSRCLSATGIRFLVILCPPGNWAFLAVGLPVRCHQGRTPTGLPRSARMSCGRGGCPFYPGDCGARTAGRSSPAAACRLAAARPCTPVQQPTTGGFLSRGIIKGSRSFTRPAFPWPVAPGWNGSPRASSPGFTPRRYRRRMPGWGQASWALT